MEAERAGVPALAVMTEQFVDAAELMARVLGAEGYGFAVIEHPISSAGPDQLVAQARRTADACASSLVASTAAG